jgi:hypothetical protein
MKTLFPIFALSVFTLQLNAQITLEKTYSGLAGVYKLDVSGVKYVVDSSNTVSFNLKFYNTDHSLFKSINFPNPYPNFSTHTIFYISENLFDLDAGIEFAVNFSNDPNSERFTIFNEDGSILFNKNKAGITLAGVPVNANGPFLGVIPTPDGTKMILQTIDPISRKVYSLPGMLACFECDGGYTGNRGSNAPEIEPMNSKIYPNPSSNLTQIDYELPEDCKMATLTVYTLNGSIVKSFTITPDFDNIILSNDELPSGNYFYIINTGTETIEGKKFEIIRQK